MNGQFITNNFETVNRADAKHRGLSRYYTGKPCVNGHYARRLVSSCGCMECNSDSWVKFIESDPYAKMDASDKYSKTEKGRAANRRASAKYRAKMRADNLDWLPL